MERVPFTFLHNSCSKYFWGKWYDHSWYRWFLLAGRDLPQKQNRFISTRKSKETFGRRGNIYFISEEILEEIICLYIRRNNNIFTPNKYLSLEESPMRHKHTSWNFSGLQNSKKKSESAPFWSLDLGKENVPPTYGEHSGERLWNIFNISDSYNTARISY